jgi:tetratricopeptide (TPR) repeat protein
MRLAFLCCVIAAVSTTQAGASAYSDFNQGVSAHNIDEPDEAIRYLTQALSAPDLPAHLRPAALMDRAHAYAWKKQYDLALADYDACVALIPGSYTVLIQRAELHAVRREFDLSRIDYSAAIKTRPELPRTYAEQGQTYVEQRRFDEAIKNYTDGLAASWYTLEFYPLRSEAYRMSARYDAAIKEDDIAISRDASFSDAFLARAHARQDSGNLTEALADYEKARNLDSEDPELPLLEGVVQWELGHFDDAARVFRRGSEKSQYIFVWNYLADAKRRDLPRGLSDKLAKLDQDRWPAPVAKLIAGTAKPDDVFAAVREGDTFQRRTQACEANFYVGEWQLIQGDKTEAKRLLSQAAQACETGALELGAAKIELSRLP